jgi:transcription-repair coupling factor (superfamily II helicase)
MNPTPPRENVPIPTEVDQTSPLGAIAVLVLGIWKAEGRDGVLIFLDSELKAEQLGAILYALEPQCDPLVYPRLDVLTYDGVPPSREITGRRASVLRRLCEPDRSPLVVSTPDAALERVARRSAWSGATLALEPGLEICEEDLRRFFEDAGYELDARVDVPGEAAMQGHVIDVFPAGALGPVRIGYADGRIQSIHAYDAASQRSASEMPQVILDPVLDRVEGTEERLETLFDYLPKARIVRDARADSRATARLEQIREAYEGLKNVAALRQRGSLPVPPERHYLAPKEWRSALAHHPVVDLGPKEGVSRIESPRFATLKAPMRALSNFIRDQTERGVRVALAAATDRDLASMKRRLRQDGLELTPSATWADVLALPAGSVTTMRVDLEAGFILPSLRVAVIAAPDVLGSRARHQIGFWWHQPELAASYESLRIGDIAVHLERGVGIVRGLEAVTASEFGEQELLRMEYAGGASIIIPNEELALVWKYGARRGVQLDRADGSSWEKRRLEVLEDIMKTARKLVSFAEERERMEAPKLVPPSDAYERFVARFPYFATPDQLRAAEDVLADLATGRPMNRLVCGDVGYGKTEVALRGVAAACLSGKQAAIVVPTTVLARQHLETFSRRFAGFGLKIGHLSRLAPAAERRRVKKGLAEGSIRIVIGTHALAGTDVRFEDLGLLVIDEEQRFGTRQKEKLKNFGKGIHVLTMTATPIPRTMQWAIAGLQSLSIIATPPARRLPVRTTSITRNEDEMRSALLHEKRRGGQSFFVCPRIDDIAPWEDRLQEMVPELGVSVIHGKMAAEEIDDTLIRFATGEGDVLLATNIIESGLDLPRANTIMIWRPDRFGLAQLHQLRGRVGRGARQGYAYLVSDESSNGTEASRERIRALQEHDRLGAGFAISQRDLDLRGAGELFGENQAGHIKLVGPALYRHLLDQAVKEARGEPVFSDILPSLNLEITGRIPRDYIGDEESRLEIYGRLAKANGDAAIDRLEDEVEDRFGQLPKEVDRLFDLARLRQACRRSGISRIDAGPQAIAVTFADRSSISDEMLASASVRPNWSRNRLIIEKASGTEERLLIVSACVERLAEALS